MADKLIKRDAYVDKLKDYVNSDFVKVYIGIRRSGKTSLMYNIIDELKLMGIRDENIIFISFESREYAHIDNSQQLDEIIFNKTANLEGKAYLFFDEIQQVKGWERSINTYRVSIDCDIYITGSNSKLLSGELATLLTGRYLTINVYPFSFKEFLQYKNEIEGIELTKDSINSLYDDYNTLPPPPGVDIDSVWFRTPNWIGLYRYGNKHVLIESDWDSSQVINMSVLEPWEPFEHLYHYEDPLLEPDCDLTDYHYSCERTYRFQSPGNVRLVRRRIGKADPDYKDWPKTIEYE